MVGTDAKVLLARWQSGNVLAPVVRRALFWSI